MDNFQIDEDNGIPVWIQVRKRLVYCIVSGYYQQGEQLPTVRELAVQLDINYNTVNKVYQDLERDGFITTKRGKGTFVAQLDTSKLLALDNKVELLADELIRSGLDIGMTATEIVNTVAERAARLENIAATSQSAASRAASAADSSVAGSSGTRSGIASSGVASRSAGNARNGAAGNGTAGSSAAGNSAARDKGFDRKETLNAG